MTFFSTIADRRRFGPYDSSLELRDKAATAITATTSGTGIEFAVRKSMPFKAIVIWDAYSSYTATSAEWTITISVSDVVGGTYTPVSQAIALVGSADGRLEIPLNSGNIAYLDADSAFIRVTATKVGSPGGLTYGAFLVPEEC